MKTALRHNRASGGTRAKVERIVNELRRYPESMQPRHPNGVFAAWRQGKRDAHVR